MKFFKNYIQFFGVILFALIFSCQTNSKSDNEGVKADTTPPKIKFENKIHDFGTLTHGQVVECNFIYKNIGGKPLKVLSVEADCGCTVPKYEKKYIKKGHEGKINITFDSEGFFNNQYKTIKVKTNDNQETKLIITAFIKSE